MSRRRKIIFPVFIALLLLVGGVFYWQNGKELLIKISSILFRDRFFKAQIAPFKTDLVLEEQDGG